MDNLCVCCGEIIPEGRQVCYSCEHLAGKEKRSYMRFNCPECGAPLEVWADSIVKEIPAEFDGFKYEERYLIRHCNKCGRDWENEWETQWGDVCETQLRRKFWG
jgi:predicted RNA-binding Zn-ribbon protein involved in translation (DUF1610 family)